MSNKLTVIRTEEQIVSEILFYVEDTRKKILYNAIEIGRRLVEAKEVVPHGEWGKWLEEKVNFKKSTANNFIKIFNEYGADQLSLLGDNLKVQTFGNITYSQALELIALDEKERIAFVENHNMEDISVRELKREISELKKKNNLEVREVTEKMEKEKEQLQKERDKAYMDISEIEESKRILEEAFNEGAEERNELENKIQALENEIEEIKDKTIDIDINKQEFEEEVQAKINALKREKEEALMKLEEYKASSNENAVRYKVHFETLTVEFKKILEVLEQMKMNETEFIKYSGATKKLINTMLQRL